MSHSVMKNNYLNSLPLGFLSTVQPRTFVTAPSL
uniref:Uncharacterized protein n=1 Tax=Anguilla anguilla TaxID=7936 RepID=A0A0E9UA76_ANGAN